MGKHDIREKTINYRVLPIILIFSILGLVFSTTATLHIHELPDGRFVVHGHPYNPDDDDGGKGNHTHTKNEYAIINFLNSLVVLTTAIIVFIIFIYHYWSFLFINRIFAFLSLSGFLSRLRRSPPLIPFLRF